MLPKHVAFIERLVTSAFLHNLQAVCWNCCNFIPVLLFLQLITVSIFPRNVRIHPYTPRLNPHHKLNPSETVIIKLPALSKPQWNYHGLPTSMCLNARIDFDPEIQILAHQTREIRNFVTTTTQRLRPRHITHAKYRHEQAMLLKQVPSVSCHLFKNYRQKNDAGVLYAPLNISESPTVTCYVWIVPTGKTHHFFQLPTNE